MQEEIAVLAAITGHQPRDEALFIEALTHGSHGAKGGSKGVNKGGGSLAGKDYQRLEFLGDRVLGLAIATELYRRFPRESEGALSSRLNALVTGSLCAEIARELGLPPLVRLGKQARDDGGRDSDNILGDVLEALIGALYIDAGIDVAVAFVIRCWGDRIGAVQVAPKHPKSALMEWAAANKRKPPEYRVVWRDGPDHAPRYTVEASIDLIGSASAEGTSKQEAERAAAAALLTKLENGV
ncbi:ribonuclease III [Sphingomonas lacunae]|uniref:Ribonuclease 3 n=1 Tax=Sphingomonas lacunae TaxID=2698828 RepID=A0A6M4AVH7_9SPHN|nr:ribonuclease III [Sphingomonas lacunae]QJQ33084.1 ribonuclease III [Sphingomonas lacunae]